jgi:septal ring factor EnvC (AmiA/AmiB activator)
MTMLEWMLQGVLLLLLAGAIPFAWRLDKRIATLRSAGGGLAEGARGIAEATEAAETALSRLRATAEQSGRLVAERIATAEKLRDDLAFLTERAEVLADRLDTLVRTARPAAAAAPAPGSATAPPSSAGARSEAERELLRALKGLR